MEDDLLADLDDYLEEALSRHDEEEEKAETDDDAAERAAELEERIAAIEEEIEHCQALREEWEETGGSDALDMDLEGDW